MGTAAAEKTKAEVKIVADAAGEKATTIGGEKAEVEKDLEAAKPALLEAEQALNAIRAEDIKNLKALKKPPDVIKIIFDVSSAAFICLFHVNLFSFKSSTGCHTLEERPNVEMPDC